MSRPVIFGVQPVLEALRTRKPLERLWIARAAGERTARIKKEAESAGVGVSVASSEDLTRRAGSDRHQGVVAQLERSAVAHVDLAEIALAADQAREPLLVVLLDGVQDPQNLGAILRSAYALGAHGVVLPKDRAAQVTPAAVRASAGAALHLPVARVTNLKHALEELKAMDVWCVAATLEGEPPSLARFEGPLALVLGGEAKGVRPSVANACDARVRIPLAHGFDSLNVSVAAGILLYEARRQRP